MTQQPSWQFPPRNGGAAYDQDPSSQYFGDAPVAKLVRETIQNSLDARDSGLSGPVVVEFRTISLALDDFDGAQLRAHLQACLNQAKAESTKRVQDAYRRALDKLKGKHIDCLTITDSGTYGLKGNRWDALVLREGAVFKQNASAGGSYGIGKNAALNVSDLRSVIYTTRYVDRNGVVEKMQGKATLMSHPFEGEERQHIGFLALSGVNPILTRDIPQTLRLEETGTRTTILGFNPRTDDWVAEVVQATLENFFHAVHHRNLVVHLIDGEKNLTTVNHETIDTHFQRIVDKENDSYSYYVAIRDVETAKTIDIPKIGTLDVHLLLAEKAPRRICLVNSNGMKITDSRDQKTNPLAPRGNNLWPDYAVVLVPNKVGDEWLRQTENVSHDALSAERFVEMSDRREAVHAFQEARRVIRSTIEESVETARDADTSNLRELAQAFPDELSPDAPGNRGLYTRIIERSIRRNRAIASEPADDQAGDGDQVEPNRIRDGEGKFQDGERTSTTGGGERTARVRRPPLDGLRFAPQTRNSARLAFSMPRSESETVSVVLRPVGSEGANENSLPVQSVKVVEPQGATAKLNRGRIELQAPSGTRVIIEVTATEPIDGRALRVE